LRFKFRTDEKRGGTLTHTVPPVDIHESLWSHIAREMKCSLDVAEELLEVLGMLALQVNRGFPRIIFDGPRMPDYPSTYPTTKPYIRALLERLCGAKREPHAELIGKICVAFGLPENGTLNYGDNDVSKNIDDDSGKAVVLPVLEFVS
jgi:hypothetical protein